VPAVAVGAAVAVAPAGRAIRAAVLVAAAVPVEAGADKATARVVAAPAADPAQVVAVVPAVAVAVAARVAAQAAILKIRLHPQAAIRLFVLLLSSPVSSIIHFGSPQVFFPCSTVIFSGEFFFTYTKVRSILNCS
jgi:hypothetical protein